MTHNARVHQPQVGWNEVLGFRATNTALLADLLCYINCTRHGGANRSKK